MHFGFGAVLIYLIILNNYKAKNWFSKLTQVFNYSMQQYGISPERLQENHDLSSFFKILTTSTDEDDKVVNLVTSFPQIMTHTPESIPKFPFFPMKNSNSCSNYQVYVSTVHAYNYPVTAFQWHPEVLHYYNNVV